MSEENTDIMSFPCQFPIKVMGIAGESFEMAVYAIINRHVPNLTEGAIKINTSKEGKYLSITIQIEAQSREQLDKIYLDLTASEHVIMAL